MWPFWRNEPNSCEVEWASVREFLCWPRLFPASGSGVNGQAGRATSAGIWARGGTVRKTHAGAGWVRRRVSTAPSARSPLLAEMRNELFAGRIFGVADVVEQFVDQ
jgi:hypothetical protein